MARQVGAHVGADAVAPAAEVAPPLAHVAHREAHPRSQLALEAEDELIRPGRGVFVRNTQILIGGQHEQVRQRPGDRIVRSLKNRLDVWPYDVGEFAGRNLGMVTAPMCFEDRSAIGSDLEVRAEARRHAVPAEPILARKGFTGRIRVLVQFVLSRRERVAVIVPDSQVQRQPADSDGIVNESSDIARSACVAERLANVLVAVGYTVVQVGVDEVVQPVHAADAGLVVLHAEVEVLLGSQEPIRMVRQLAGDRRTGDVVGVPVVVGPADNPGDVVVKPRL